MKEKNYSQKVIIKTNEILITQKIRLPKTKLN